MDFRRPNRHFQLSPDPRQPQPSPVQNTVAKVSNTPQPAVEPVPQFVPANVEPLTPQVIEPAPSSVVEPMPESVPEQSPVPEVDFLPPPPEVPVLEPPVIESMQAPVEPEVVTLIEAPKPVAVTKPEKEKGYIATKKVVVGAVAVLLLFVGSIVFQQLQIQQLKKERKLQSEQLMQVNPVSAGKAK